MSDDNPQAVEPPTPEQETSSTRHWIPVIIRWGLWIALVVVIWQAVRVLARVDWGAVRDAVSLLSWWQVLVLLALVILRQMCSGAPLAMFTQGLGLKRAVANDLVGNLTSTITPAPADIVARAALFKVWGIPVAQGLAGLVLNSVLFYAIRLAAPVAGALILLSVGEEGVVLGWTAVISGLSAVAIGVFLAIILHNTHSASALGRFSGRYAVRLNPKWPGPEELEFRFLEFQRNVAGRWERYGFASAIVLAAMALLESFVVVFSLRFVGVSADEATTLTIVGAHLSLYILTAAPFQGIGVFDGALVATIASHSTADPAALVAGVIIWRVMVQLVPLIAGIFPSLTLRRINLAMDLGEDDADVTKSDENNPS